ncbi:MAG: hypothetical protein A2Z72_00270 [Omnitrophica bacterium RBG_13_46_9]|nr:MAG: hypothetical protein A2Z72_00270 [Omnitrophica bacterium RBG_13_46_9]
MAFGSGFRSTDRAEPCKKRSHRCKAVELHLFSNALGLFLMYANGKYLILSSKNRKKATAFLLMFVFIYSAVMIYLDKQGKLLPLNAFFERYRTIR